jgi:hypothetical protein
LIFLETAVQRWLVAALANGFRVYLRTSVKPTDAVLKSLEGPESR